MDKILDFVFNLPMWAISSIAIIYFVLMLSSFVISYIFQHLGKTKQRNIFIAISVAMLAILTIILVLFVITLYKELA